MSNQKIKPIVNLYQQVLATAVRVRELKRGHKSLVTMPKTARFVTTAIAELEQGKIGMEMLMKLK